VILLSNTDLVIAASLVVLLALLSLRLQAATMHNVINWTATIAPRPGVR